METSGVNTDVEGPDWGDPSRSAADMQRLLSFGLVHMKNHNGWSSSGTFA